MIEKENTTIEQETQRKYAGQCYHAGTICHAPVQEPRKYFDVLLAHKFNLLKKYAANAIVLDCCCATGVHLVNLAPIIKKGVGVDFSEPFIDQAKEASAQSGTANIEFLVGNARELVFEQSTFDLVYCFSSLYYIPDLGQVLTEIARVLRPNGHAILEFGNKWSLNTIVCRAYPELAAPCHCSVGNMIKLLEAHQLVIREHLIFQMLPLWGRRPLWLLPILLPIWEQLLQHQIRGRMVDEWLCLLPGLHRFAFRHIFVCEKQ